jgi:hypothetical protein
VTNGKRGERGSEKRDGERKIGKESLWYVREKSKRVIERERVREGRANMLQGDIIK